MSTPKIVEATGEGLNMDPVYLFSLGLIQRGPKWDIRCGECRLHFEQRLPLTDYPIFRCPWCDTVNVLNLVWSTE